MGFFNFLNKTKKAIKDIQQKVSRTLVLNTSFGTAHWSERDYDNFARETYMKNVIAYRCIFYIASSVSQVKWSLYKQVGKKREEVLDNPISKLLQRANPDESFIYLVQRCLSFLLIAGNSFIEKVGATGGKNKGIPRELYCLRPDKLKINTNKDTGVIENYEYDNKIKFEIDSITGKSDILHIKLFHPADDYFGLSVTEPTAREIDSSNEAIEWQKKVFENEGRPGMVVSVSGFLPEPQFERLQKQLKDNHGGSDNAGKNLILEGETASTATPYNWSPKEMDWIESNRELARRICLGYGVPPQLLGIPGDSTFNNYKEARASFWEETVIYYLRLITEEFNNWLFEDNQIFLDYDLNEVPALAYKQDLKWERVKTASFMTENEKREMVGLEAKPGLDIILVSMGTVPLDQILTTEEEPVQDQEQQDEQSVQELVEQGYDEETAKQIIGVTYE